MSDTVLLAIGVAVIASFVAWIFIVFKGFDVAEHKLGRRLALWEIAAIGLALPYSLAFIVLMPPQSPASPSARNNGGERG